MGRARRLWSWAKRRARRLALAGLLGAGLLLNLLAYAHARAMTHFVPAGRSTPPPEALDWRGRARALLLGVQVARPETRRTPDALGLPWERLETAAPGGPRLELWRLPRERPRGVALLCHGYAGTKDSLLPEARAFRELGFEVLLLDFRGSGGSGGQVTSLGWHEARDLAAAARLARGLAGGSRLVVFGRSMGAVAALRAVHVEGVRPQALVLEAPFDRLLHTIRRRFQLLGVPAFPGAELLCLWGGVQLDVQAFAHDPLRYAASVTCPTLTFHGAKDLRVSPAEARAVHEALASERKRFLLFPARAHEPFLASEGPTWRAALSEFLGPLDTPTPRPR